MKKKMMHNFNSAIIIEIDYDLQIARLIARDKISIKLANKIISTQATNQDRKNIGNYIPSYYIKNSGSQEDLAKKIEQLAKKLKLKKIKD